MKSRNLITPSPNNAKITISKVPSTPCTRKKHFECLESGANDSTRVRRLTDTALLLLRRARVKMFILAYVSFWLQLSGFSTTLTRRHETKTVKPIPRYLELQIKIFELLFQT